MDDLKIFAQFTKRDEDQHLVEGWASTEALDSQGEVVESGAIEKALPDYMKYANVREMHQWKAAGKTIQANVDKVKKGLYLVAKIVDSEAWQKCKEGVYNGFSIGGRVLKRMNNTIQELSLNEISLVDRPANPEAVFTMVKIDNGKVEDMQVDVAKQIIDLARESRSLLNKLETEGKSTFEAQSALSNLKELAQKTLTGEDKEEFEKVLYTMDFAEMDKLTKVEKTEPQKQAELDIKKFVDHSWMPGYFNDLKKVLK